MTDGGPAATFPLLDEFHGIRMGLDLSELRPGCVGVVESARRLRREQSYGYIQALLWMWLEDGRPAVSVPPGAGAAVLRIANGVEGVAQLFDPSLADRLKLPVNAALREAGLPGVDRTLCDLVFACNADLLLRHECGDCRRLTDASIPAAEGAGLPRHCFPDGIAYGVVVEGQVVSVAFAHRTGLMEERVADLGVGTAPGYRRRGFAKTAVSAVAAHIARAGGEARYGCSPENHASAATARSVGFVPYGAGLTLSAPVPAASSGR